MKVALIRIDAQDGSGVASPVYLASHDLRDLVHIDGTNEWIPGIARLPRLRYDFFAGEFYGAITAPTAQFAISKEAVADFDTLYFADARVRVWSGEIGGSEEAEYVLNLDFLTQSYEVDDGEEPAGIGGLELRFDGLIQNEPRVENSIADFTATVDDSWLDQPLLDVYAGTDGIEGPEELTGLPKPLVFGAAKFCAGVLIDSAENVYQVHDGACEGITAAYDRLASLGASTGDYANLAALIAASIPAGSWGTCKALGLVRLGAPPDGLVSFDVSGDNADGYVRKAGAIIKRIAAIKSGTADATSMTGLDTDRAYNLNMQITTQTTAREVIQQIAGSVAAVAFVGWDGTLYAHPLGYDTPSETLDTDGSGTRPVGDILRAPIASPFWRVATYAEPTWVVHDRADIATGYVLRGEYSATRTYRLDDVVNAPDPDGRVFAYINATPAAGQALPTAPATSNSYWELAGAADVTASAQVVVTPPTAQIVYRDYLGEPKSGQFNRTLTPVVTRGGTSIRTDNATSYSISNSGVTATVNNTNGSADKGRITVTDGGAGSIALTVTVSGVAYGPYSIPFTVVDDAPPSSGGGGAGGGSDSTLAEVTSTTFAAMTRVDAGESIFTVTISGAGDTINGVAPLTYEWTISSGSGSNSLVAKWQYRELPSGSWTDFDTALTGTAATYDADEFSLTLGALNVNQTVSGLSAADYEVRMVGKKNTADGNFITVATGTATVSVT